jgi:hypothetical protein
LAHVNVTTIAFLRASSFDFLQSLRRSRRRSAVSILEYLRN